ncbi:O-antigen ligase family protein [Paraburkholderia sp. C35]|uniref:O-antigen ligase family protein n=1 Tax=Paraburkholderia sp. C35 TaxID=2126993 RepID=UPI0013A586F9|nr:O-antigen ligase family protein [Paraburkholderia sp. C35]
MNALIILMGVAIVIQRGIRVLRTPLIVWLTYLVYALYSLARSPDPFEGFRLFLGLLSTFMVFTIALNVTGSRRQAETLLKCILYSSIPVAVFGIIQYAMINGFSGRLQSTFEHPNILAFYLVLVLTCIFYVRHLGMMPRAFPARLGRYAYLALLLVFLLLTQTRSAWIAAVVGFALYACLANRKLLIGLVLIPPLLLVPAVSDRLSDLGSNGSAQDIKNGVQLDSLSWRQLLWQYALIDSNDARVVGKGLGSFRNNSQFFFPLEATADAHSAYIQTIYEMGAVGLALYVATFAAMIIAIRKIDHNRKRGAIAIALIAAYLLESYSDNTIYYLSFNWYFWALIGCHMSVCLRDRYAQQIFMRDKQIA